MLTKGRIWLLSLLLLGLLLAALWWFTGRDKGSSPAGNAKFVYLGEYGNV